MKFSWLDWKLGARMLVKYPGLSLISVAALSMAIATGVGIFYFIDREMNPRLPLHDGDRIVTLATWDAHAGREEGRVLSDLPTWRRQLKSVERLGAYRTFERNLTGLDGRTLPVRAAETSASMFAVTAVKPMLGRELNESDELVNAPAVVVLGNDVWRRRFNSDRSIVGRTIKLGHESAMVIGVMPEGFAFPRVQQLWMPLRSRQLEALQGPAVSVFGKLAEGATLETARAELALLGRNMAASQPQTHANLQPEIRKFGVDRGDDSPGILVLSLYLSSFMVLFAACANVATLVFARTAMRESEIVVRNALGASRTRVMSQLFVEALVLSLVSAAIGIAVFAAFLRFVHYQIVVVRGIAQSFWITDSLSIGMVLQALVLATVGAAVIGLLPAMKATGARVQNALQDIRGGGALKFGGVWSLIIVMQVALTVLSLPVGIAATSRTIREHRIRAEFASSDVMTFKSGLDREGMLSADGELSESDYRARVKSVYSELARRIAAEPGVQAVTFADALPGMSHPVYKMEAQRAGETPTLVASNMDGYIESTHVDVGFFDAFRIPLVSGRSFNNGDVGTETKPVIINESLARNIGGNPLGVRLRYAPMNGAKPGDWFEVVGVAKNLGLDPTGHGEADFIFIASDVSEIDAPAFAVRASGNTASLALRIPDLVLQVDPALRAFDVTSLQEVVRRRDVPGIMTSLGAVVLAALAVMLSSACLFALMSVSVAKRTREIGVRLALGASVTGILRAVFARSAAQVGAGIVVGNIAVFALITWLSDGFRPDLILPMAGVSLLMGLVGVCACAVPAWRVLRVHPTEALRETA